MFTIEIVSGGRGHNWISEFVADLNLRGASADRVLCVPRFIGQNMSQEEANRAFDEAPRRYIQSRVFPLLRPDAYKWCFRYVAEMTCALIQDKRVIVVCDASPLSVLDDDDPDTVQEVNILRKFLEEKFRGRILTREEAIEHLCHQTH